MELYHLEILFAYFVYENHYPKIKALLKRVVLINDFLLTFIWH